MVVIPVRLSRAARLLAAVERVTERDGNSFNVCQHGSLWEANTLTTYAVGHSAVDALLALGEQTNEPI
jgi:hypothetical protein